jgi:hypothetical protein
VPNIQTRTNSSAISAPSSTTRQMADLIGKFTNRLEDKPGDFRRKLLSASLAPAGDERDALEQRRAELQRSLAPTPGDEANDVIYAIFVGSDTFGMDGRETDAKVAVYAQHLEGQPTWAIEEARRRFGKPGWKCNWNGRGVPSPQNINAECSFITLDIETEIARIGAILDAELVDNDTTADERKAAVARWEAVKAGMRQNNVTDSLDARAEAQRAEQLRANERVRQRALEEKRKAESEVGA